MAPGEGSCSAQPLRESSPAGDRLAPAAVGCAADDSGDHRANGAASTGLTAAPEEERKPSLLPPQSSS